MKCVLNALLCAGWLCGPALAAAASVKDQVTHYRMTHEAAILGQLDELARTRSIAADPAGITAAANRLQDLLKERGFEARLLSEGGAPPLIFGELKTPGARHTVVFYAHYDGQPVTPSQWSSDPFSPVMRTGPLGSGEHEVDWKAAQPPFDPQWRFYGRAISDDKASIVAFLSAFDALKAAGRRPSANIKVVWDGEEERGSPHLEKTLKDNRALFTGDLWLVGDAPVHQSRRQTLYFGARGGFGLEATVYGPVRALHDGHYGNWAPNPAAMAATLIAQMRDDNGNILIPGFADDVRPLTAAERKAIDDLPPVDSDLKREFGIGRSEGQETLALSVMRPAINIRGLRAGQVGEAAASAIPPDASISLDIRVVPDQTPQHVRAKVEEFLVSKGWTIVRAEPDMATRLAHPRLIRLQWEVGYPALRSSMSTPTAKAVIAAAGAAAGRPVAVLPMMGGSVPIYLFAEIFQQPVIGLPIVNHDNNQHATNENLRLQNLWDGIDTYAQMLGSLNW